MDNRNVFRQARVRLLLVTVGWLATGGAAALEAEHPDAGSGVHGFEWDYSLQEEPLETPAWEAGGPWEATGLAGEATGPAEIPGGEMTKPFGWRFPRFPACGLLGMDLEQPLQGTSWLNRPYYASAFSGTWLGDSLISGQVNQETGFFSGVRVGTDLSHDWGGELRFSLFYINTTFSDGSRGSESRNLVGDANLLYYPWGDSRWRPYGSIGLGFAGVHFSDQNGATVDHTGLQLPVGLGVKYLWRNWLAWRLDIKDNITFSGNGVKTTDSWSFVGGVEVHWGSQSSLRYAPW